MVQKHWLLFEGAFPVFGKVAVGTLWCCLCLGSQWKAGATKANQTNSLPPSTWADSSTLAALLHFVLATSMLFFAQHGYNAR